MSTPTTDQPGATSPNDRVRHRRNLLILSAIAVALLVATALASRNRASIIGPAAGIEWHLTHGFKVRFQGYTIPVPLTWFATPGKSGWVLQQSQPGGARLIDLMFSQSSASQSIPPQGLKGFGRRLPPPVLYFGGRQLYCQEFGEDSGAAVLIRCITASGLVAGALGPAAIVDDLRSELGGIKPATAARKP